MNEEVLLTHTNECARANKEGIFDKKKTRTKKKYYLHQKGFIENVALPLMHTIQNIYSIIKVEEKKKSMIKKVESS